MRPGCVCRASLDFVAILLSVIPVYLANRLSGDVAGARG